MGVGVSCATICSGGACGISWASLGWAGEDKAGLWVPKAGGTMAPGGGKGPDGTGQGREGGSWGAAKLGGKSCGGCGPIDGKSLRGGPCTKGGGIGPYGRKGKGGL